MAATATEFTLITQPGALTEFTDDLRRWTHAQTVQTGHCSLWLRHTSAGLIICENADPDVQRDLHRFFWDLAPDGDPRFIHTAEGADDMPAHVKSV